MENNRANQKNMEKFQKDELLGLLPTNLRTTKELTKTQKLVLSQLIVYNRLDFAKDKGYFYRTNTDLCNDLGISEPTLILAVGKLEDMGFIERKRGKRGIGASEYIVFKDVIERYSITKNEELSKQEIKIILDRIGVLEDAILSLAAEIKEIKSKNFSTEAEIEKEAEAELVYKKLKDNNSIIDNININNNKDNNTIIIKNINKNNTITKIDNNSNIQKDNKLNNKINIIDSSRTEEKGTLDCCFLDPSDFEEDFSYLEDLNKRLAYARWDNE